MKHANPGCTGDANPPAAAGHGHEARREGDKIACQQQDASLKGHDGVEAAAKDPVTIGQALQAAALSPAGGRPVDHADAAAVLAAEKSATGQGGAVPGGVAAMAQWAARTNMYPPDARGGEEAKVTLRDVLGHASALLPGNKEASWLDAEKVAAATGSSAGRGGGGMGEVADAVAAAAKINEGATL